jgi:hypothetical protein
MYKKVGTDPDGALWFEEPDPAYISYASVPFLGPHKFGSSIAPVYLAFKLNLTIPPEPVNDKFSDTVNDKASDDMSVLENVNVVLTVAIIFY